jgi:hypothetical protein
MDPSDAIGAFGALFIIGMSWLRTRMHYGRGGPGRRELTRAGAAYFASLVLLLLLGWFVAPPLVQRLSTAPFLTPVFARVAWFLLVYYAFIALHRTLQARGVGVFAVR